VPLDLPLLTDHALLNQNAQLLNSVTEVHVLQLVQLVHSTLMEFVFEVAHLLLTTMLNSVTVAVQQLLHY